MTILLATIALPSGLLWPDEYSGMNPVAQTVKRRLDGGLAVYPRAQIGGRAITLTATADHWLTRAQADALTALAADPGGVYPLTLRGQTYSVMFRHHDGRSLDLVPLIDYEDPEADDPIIGSINLMTVV